MSNFDRWEKSEHRRRFRATGIALVLVVTALILPVADAQHEWVKTQMIFLSSLFLAFQVGQVWHAMRMTRARDADRAQQFQSSSPRASSPVSAPTVLSPSSSLTDSANADVQDVCSHSGATMTASGASSVALRKKQQVDDKPVGMGAVSHQNRAYVIEEDKIEIRAYANLEEARRHGWVFGPAIAVFSGQPVPESATLGAKTYAYSGLGPNRNTGLVAPDTRLFGSLSYRLKAPLSA